MHREEFAPSSTSPDLAHNFLSDRLRVPLLCHTQRVVLAY